MEPVRYFCLTCLGEYDDRDGKGLRYYHACPDLSDAELEVMGIDPATATRAQRVRPDKRDENVVVDQDTKRVRVKREGLGRELVEKIARPNGFLERRRWLFEKE